MSAPLPLAAVATEIGRSEIWLSRNWPKLVAKAGFPLPLHETRPFVWAPEHIEAWKDRRLTEALKARVVEIRGRTPGLAEQQGNGVQAQQDELRKRFAVA